MKQIKNIAFDLGGVVLALSLEGGIKGFEKIGVRDARQRLDAYQQKGVFADLESGRISKEEFRQVRTYLERGVPPGDVSPDGKGNHAAGLL